jgi:UDP-MurNAc hydroxylase
LQQYKADWAPWLADYKDTWPKEHTDLVTALNAWWGPLLAMAPMLRAAVGGGCVMNTDGLSIYIDFAGGVVVPFDGQQHKYRFTIPRPLLESVVASKAVDWSNSLFLSCRFSAWREGEYNEYLYNFFKSLSVERMRRAEQEVVRKNAPDSDVSDEIELGDYVMQRKCPHRQAGGEEQKNDTAHGERNACSQHPHRRFYGKTNEKVASTKRKAVGGATCNLAQARAQHDAAAQITEPACDVACRHAHGASLGHEAAGSCC